MSDAEDARRYRVLKTFAFKSFSMDMNGTSSFCLYLGRLPRARSLDESIDKLEASFAQDGRFLEDFYEKDE